MLRINRLLIVLLLAALILSACQPIVAQPAIQQPAEAAALHTVKGDIHFMAPTWGNLTISFHIDVHEIDPATHTARGPVNWTIFSPTSQEGGSGWRGLDSQAQYAIFGEDIEGADPHTVVLITQITARNGWGQGDPGVYAYFWLKDSGLPEGKGDQWGMLSYKLDPWIEFYPENDPPAIDHYITMEEMKQNDPTLPINIEMGDVQITPPEADGGAASAQGVEAPYAASVNITGNVDFAVPDWGLQHGWFHFNVLAPKKEEEAPSGWVRWVEVNDKDELRYVMAEPRCITFSQDGKSVLTTLQITNRRGWGDGQADQWINLWLRDGGSPGAGKDAFATPFWPPQDENPGCAYVEPEANIIMAVGGDLVIHK